MQKCFPVNLSRTSNALLIGQSSQAIIDSISVSTVCVLSLIRVNADYTRSYLVVGSSLRRLTLH